MFFGLMAVICAIAGRRQRVLGLLGLGTTAGVGLLAVLALNYLTTGLPSDNGIAFFWPVIDIPKLQAWGVLPNVVLIMAGRLAFAQAALPFDSLQMRDFLKNVFRLDVLFPLVAVTAAAASGASLYAALRAASTRASGTAPEAFSAPGIGAVTWLPIGAVLGFIACTLFAALIIGRTQPISFVRYASFILPMMAALIALGWQTIARLLPRTGGVYRKLHIALPFLILGVAVATTNLSYRDAADPDRNFRAVHCGFCQHL
jgi:hypothetical protein